MINVALFGITAKEWKDNNPNLTGNIRDYADILHLIILSNLEVINANMIDNNINQSERLIKLNDIARNELKLLMSDKNIFRINNLNYKYINNKEDDYEKSCRN